MWSYPSSARGDLPQKCKDPEVTPFPEHPTPPEGMFAKCAGIRSRNPLLEVAKGQLNPSPPLGQREGHPWRVAFPRSAVR